MYTSLEVIKRFLVEVGDYAFRLRGVVETKRQIEYFLHESVEIDSDGNVSISREYDDGCGGLDWKYASITEEEAMSLLGEILSKTL